MDNDITNLALRVDELEARLAQQDQASLDLSDELYRQQRQISNLEAQIRHLSDRLKETELPRQATEPADEVPPHY